MVQVQHNHTPIPHSISPLYALQLLKEGNFRFINNLNMNRDLLEQVNETKDGQWPFAAILSCMDSRTSAELIFDQGLGDIFSIRIAGNIVTPGILASLEYALAVAGSKIIIVLGHTGCGAVKGACDHMQLGHLNAIIDKIAPAIEAEQNIKDDRTSNNPAFVEAVSNLNARNSVKEILQQSTVIRDLIEKGEAGIIPAMYDVATGKVKFYDEEGLIRS